MEQELAASLLQFYLEIFNCPHSTREPIPVSWIPALNSLFRSFCAPTSPWPPASAQTMAILLWEHKILEFPTLIPKRIFLSSQTWLPSHPIIFISILSPHLHSSIGSWGISTPSWNGNGSCWLFLTCWYHLKIPVQVLLACPLLLIPNSLIPPYSSFSYQSCTF